MCVTRPGDAVPTDPIKTLDLPGQELIGHSLTSYAGTVYHYTDAPGLRGMLATGRVWASQASSLNDRSEAIDGWRRLHDMLLELGSSDLHSFVARGQEFAREASARVFVVSASTEPNDVNQWRLYATDGWGYSLAIPPGPLQVHHEPRTQQTSRLESLVLRHWRPELRPWIKVIYTDEHLRDVVRELIESVAAWEDRIAQADPAESDGLYDTLGQMIDDDLATIAYLVKPAGFRGENEVRTVVTLKAASFLAKGPARTLGAFPPDFRAGTGGIVGYFELGWDDAATDAPGSIPWSEIICGPRHRHGGDALATVHDETIKMLATSAGLEGIKVRTSDISLR